MDREKEIHLASEKEIKSWDGCNFEKIDLKVAFQEGADWADKHSYNLYYTMSNCPNCKYVLFYNPYHNDYFVGKLDGDDNLVIDNEIQGKVSEFNYLYWTNLPEFNKDNVVDYSK